MGGLITTEDMDGIDYTNDDETFEIAPATLVYSGSSLEYAVTSGQQQSTSLNRGFLVATDFFAVAFAGDDAVITNTATADDDDYRFINFADIRVLSSAARGRKGGSPPW